VENIEYKSYQVKSFDSVKGEITGYGVTYGNEDRVKDVALKGALQEAIEDFYAGVPIKFLFEHENALELNANIENIQDDNVGSIVKAKVSESAKIKLPRHFQRIVQAFKNKKAFLSIGFIPIDVYVIRNGSKVYIYKDGTKIGERLPNETRYLEKIKAMEFSFTTNPANMEAKIFDLKSINVPKYPVELTENWDSEVGNKSWREYSNSMEVPSEMYKKGFLYHKKDEANNFSSYHYPVVHVVDGEPMINQAAVLNAYKEMQSSKAVPSNDIPMLSAVVKELFQKINKVRGQEGLELLPEPDFKMYEIDSAIENINTRASAEKFVRNYKNEYASFTERQRNKVIEKCMNIGIAQYKKSQEKKLDIQENIELKNAGSAIMETRSSSDAVVGTQNIDFNQVYEFLKNNK
jgi:hypothetical protein